MLHKEDGDHWGTRKRAASGWFAFDWKSVDKDDIGAQGTPYNCKENITFILFFYLEWKVLHALLCAEWVLWPCKKIKNKKRSEKRTNLLVSLLKKTLVPRGGFQPSTAERLPCLFSSRGWYHHTGSEVLLTSAPQLVFNNSHDCNKATISADISPAGVKRGQWTIFTSSSCTSGVLNHCSYRSREPTKDTKYEFMALAVR